MSISLMHVNKLVGWALNGVVVIMLLSGWLVGRSMELWLLCYYLECESVYSSHTNHPKHFNRPRALVRRQNDPISWSKAERHGYREMTSYASHAVAN